MRERRDRVTALALVAILLVLGILFAPSGEQSSRDFRFSSFRSAPAGAKALYLTLEELGFSVERRLTPYVEADSLAGPLLLLAPSQSPSPDELAELARWIERGGTLLYAARPGDLTLDTLGLSLVDLRPDSAWLRWRGQWARPVPGRRVEDGRPIPGIRWAFADSSAALTAPGATPLLTTREGETVALSFRRGAGRVVAWSDPGPLRNAELRESGAALPFARAAAELHEGRPLIWDEYHHGYRGGGSAAAATLRFLRDTRPGYAVLQLLAVGLGMLWLLGSRFGAPLPSPPAHRRSPLEHVDALAGAYRQAGARHTARDLLLAGLARRLGWRIPMEGGARAVLDRLRASTLSQRDAARVLEQEWQRADRADLVVLARTTDRLLTEAKQS